MQISLKRPRCYLPLWLIHIFYKALTTVTLTARYGYFFESIRLLGRRLSSRSPVLKPKLKHLRHPLRTLAVAKSMSVAYFKKRTFADRGDQQFAQDPRYNLQNVTAGFTCRRDFDTDDTALLNRICVAYKATVEHPECDRPAYRATGWWQQIRHHNLTAVRQALLENDIAALSSMYRNFFR